MDDRPTALELLHAVGEFLERDLLPAIADRRLRYQVLVALSALRMAARELPGEAERLRAELAGLAELLGAPPVAPPEGLAALRQRVLEANLALCERIRAGLADQGPWRERLLRHLDAVAEAKLGVTNPRELEALRSESRTGAS